MLTNDYDLNPTTFWFDLNGCPENPPLQPGNTIEVEYQWHNSDDRWLTYHPITVWGEADTDMLYASGQSGLMEFYGNNNQTGYDQMAPTKNSSATLNTTETLATTCLGVNWSTWFTAIVPATTSTTQLFWVRSRGWNFGCTPRV